MKVIFFESFKEMGEEIATRRLWYIESLKQFFFSKKEKGKKK
jgi:hypothetical protein